LWPGLQRPLGANFHWSLAISDNLQIGYTDFQIAALVPCNEFAGLRIQAEIRKHPGSRVALGFQGFERRVRFAAKSGQPKTSFGQ
jgi:hypothetical protein